MVGRVSYKFLYKNFTATIKCNCFWVAVMGVRIPPPRQTSHVIARSLPGDIKEKGLAVLVEIGGGMFLT